MKHTTLIVPGYRGSGPAHWQSWLETQLPEVRRVVGIDWELPLLGAWATTVRREIKTSPQPVWLVAHSFGCLAAVVAASSVPERIAGMLLVAPADPERFTAQGLREDGDNAPSIAQQLPARQLGPPSAVVASTDDPWLRLMSAAYWAERWGSRLVNAGAAGHINAESGYGPWPAGLALLESMQAPHGAFLLGDIKHVATATKPPAPPVPPRDWTAGRRILQH